MKSMMNDVVSKQKWIKILFSIVLLHEKEFEVFLILNYFYHSSFYLLTLPFVYSILSVHLLFWTDIIKMTSFKTAPFFNFFISRIINIEIKSYKTLNVSMHRVEAYCIYFIKFVLIYFRFIFFDFFNFLILFFW